MPRKQTSATAEFSRKLSKCEQAIGYVFQDQDLLCAALTHASGAKHRLASNERLEFLGDAILGSVVCEMLFRKFPHFLEGDLTKIKSIVVSRETCAKISLGLDLEGCLILGKGMAAQKHVPLSLLADVFESLVAAIHIDGGEDASRDFVVRHTSPQIEMAISGEAGNNFKSQLQQLTQKEFGTTPNYCLIEEKGPDHSKHFRIAASVDDTLYSPAWGRNKKEAEQRAACNALAQIEGKAAPFPTTLSQP